MTPLPINPTVVILVKEDGTLPEAASNICPEFIVQVTNDRTIFNDLAAGRPFRHTAQYAYYEPFNKS